MRIIVLEAKEINKLYVLELLTYQNRELDNKIKIRKRIRYLPKYVSKKFVMFSLIHPYLNFMLPTPSMYIHIYNFFES